MVTSKNNQNEINNNNNNIKIIEKDGFKFIDDDDEPIILYENHINNLNILNNQNNNDGKEDLNFKQFNIEDDDFLFENNILVTNENLNNQEENIKDIKQEISISNQKDIESLQQTNNLELTNNETNDELDDQKINNDSSTNFSTQFIINDDSFKKVNEQETLNNKKIEENEYFVKPNKKEKKLSNIDKNKKTQINEIDKSFYSKYVIISSYSARKLFKEKFLFNILSLTLWMLAFIASFIILFIGVYSKIKNSQKVIFTNLDLIFISIVLAFSLSFSIYHLINIIRFKFAKNELKLNKKIDELDYIKIKKIYIFNKKLKWFTFWLLCSVTLLFVCTILVIASVHYFSNNYNKFLLSKSFYGSIVVYSFLFVIFCIYLISFLVMNKTIESDELFKQNNNLSYYKALNRKSCKIGLITFLTITIFGLIIYGIVIAIMKNKKEKKSQEYLIMD